MFRFILYVIFITVVLTGCSSYHPLPLPSGENNGEQTLSGYADIRILAKEINHPVIEPIDFNDLNGLSPDEAAILAVIVNPKLKAARDKKKLASAQLLQAGLLPNPVLSYDMEFPTGGDTTDAVTAYGAGLDWEISSLIAREAKVTSARYDLNSVSLDIAWQEWQVAEAAKLHTYRLIFAYKQLALTEDALTSQKEYHQLIDKGFTLGEKTSLQLSNANSAVQKAELSALTARQGLKKELLALNQAIGLPPNQKVNLQKDINIPYFNNLPTQEELLETIANRRLDLLALRDGYQSQEAKVRAAIKSQFPRINIGPSAGRDIEDVDTAGFDLSVDLPFFDRNQGHIAIERATRKQLFDEYSARLSDARFEIAKILAEIESTRKQIDAVQHYLAELEKLSESYKKAAENGSGDYLSYYQTLNDLYSRRIELQGLQGQLVETGIALEIASGQYLPAEKVSQAKVNNTSTGYGNIQK